MAIDTSSPSGQTIQKYFKSILLREPDDGTFNVYLSAVDTSKTLTLDQVKQSLLNSAEKQIFVDPVVRLYQAAFDRAPDVSGLTGWVKQYRANEATLDDIAYRFTQSSEFTTLYPTTTDRAVFVKALYNNVLGREPDAGGLSFWTTANISTKNLLLSFSQSAEFVARTQEPIKLFLTDIADGNPLPTKLPLPGGKDVVPPTLSIAFDKTDIGLGDAATATLKFSEKVTGFDLSDLKVDGGTLSDLATTDQITFTAKFIAVKAGAVSITFSSTGEYKDLAGNVGSLPVLPKALTVGGTSTVNFTPPVIQADPNESVGITKTGTNPNGENLDGTSGRDTLTGLGGGDSINGLGGSDTLIGGDGADRINGGDGNDILDGGKGDDVLDGGAGINQLTLGEGKDVVIFNTTTGYGVVTDFKVGEDSVDMRGTGVTATSFAQRVTTTEYANGTLLELGAQKLWLAGVKLSTVTDLTGVFKFDTTPTPTNSAPTDIIVKTVAGAVATELSIRENNPNNTTIGTAASTDPDIGDVLTYSLLNDANGRFKIGGSTGVISIADTSKLDYETLADRTTTIKIKVADEGGLFKEADVTIKLTDDPSDNPITPTPVTEVKTSASSFTLAATDKNLTFTGTGAFQGKGNALDNVITGGAGNDSLYGEGGNDTLRGLDGNDVLVGGAGNDILDGGKGSTWITSGAGKDTIVVTKDSGFTHIFDFEDGMDKIDVKAFGIKSTEFASKVKLTVYDGGTQVKFDGVTGPEIWIQNQGLSKATIGSEDFILA